MPEPLDLKNAVDDILSYYETSIHSMGSIFEGPHLILNEFQESLLDTREETERVNTQLRDILAKNEHLRRRDFDHMMEGILLAQDEREKEVRDLLGTYLREQKEMAQDLRERLKSFRISLGEGDGQRVREFREMVSEILARQDERKEEVASRIKEFQQEQKTLRLRLKELLAKGRELRIKDVKLMLREFRAQRKERITYRQRKAEEIHSALRDFREQRKAGNRDCRD